MATPQFTPENTPLAIQPLDSIRTVPRAFAINRNSSFVRLTDKPLTNITHTNRTQNIALSYHVYLYRHAQKVTSTAYYHYNTGIWLMPYFCSKNTNLFQLSDMRDHLLMLCGIPTYNSELVRKPIVFLKPNIIAKFRYKDSEEVCLSQVTYQALIAEEYRDQIMSLQLPIHTDPV